MSCPVCTRDGAKFKKLSVTKRNAKIENNKIGKVLGSGGTSVVYMIKNTKNRAIKIINIEHLAENKNNVQVEIANTLYLQNIPYIKDHIPHIYDVRYIMRNKGPQLAIEMDFIAGNPVYDLYSAKQNMPRNISIFIQGLKLIKELNKLGYRHRDIKADNLIYNSRTNKLTLIDFSFICNVNCSDKCIDHCSGSLGTRNFMHRNIGKYYLEADVYSLAMTIAYIMFKGLFQWDKAKTNKQNYDLRREHILKNFNETDSRYTYFKLLLKSLIIGKNGKDINLKQMMTIDLIIEKMTNLENYQDDEIIEMIAFNIKFLNKKNLSDLYLSLN